MADPPDVPEAQSHETDKPAQLTTSIQTQNQTQPQIQPEDEAIPKPSTSRQIMVVTAGALVMFTTCAFIFTYGVYQSLYEEMAQHPSPTPFTHASTAQIGLIGTLAIALMSMGGPFAMLWSKLYSPQLVIIAGGWICGLALILASFGTALWHFTLTQGVLLGIGVCLSYVPTMSVCPTWFDQRRALAMGIVISGTGVGGMIWPPALRAMISNLGFRNALRISGCISLIVVSVSGYTLSWEPRFHAAQVTPRRGRWSLLKVPLVSWRIAKSKRFVSHALGCFLQSAAYTTPLFFSVAFAQALGYDATTAANFVTINNAANTVARIVIGHAADRYGRINALFLTTLVSAVVVFAFWLPATFSSRLGSSSSSSIAGEALYIVFTVLYGAFASAYISLFPASLIELFGVREFTSVNGALYLIRGIGAFGTPLIGLLVPGGTALMSTGVYERAVITVGVLLVAASVACGWVRVEAGMLKRGDAQEVHGRKKWKV